MFLILTFGKNRGSSVVLEVNCLKYLGYKQMSCTGKNNIIQLRIRSFNTLAGRHSD